MDFKRISNGLQAYCLGRIHSPQHCMCLAMCLQRDIRQNFFEQIEQAKGFALECVAKCLVKLRLRANIFKHSAHSKFLGLCGECSFQWCKRSAAEQNRMEKVSNFSQSNAFKKFKVAKVSIRKKIRCVNGNLKDKPFRFWTFEIGSSRLEC